MVDAEAPEAVVSYQVDIVGTGGDTVPVPAVSAEEAAQLAGFALRDPAVARVTIYHGDTPAGTVRWNAESGAAEAVGACVGIDWSQVAQGAAEFDRQADAVVRSDAVQSALGPYAPLVNLAHDARMRAMHGERPAQKPRGPRPGGRDTRSRIMEAQAVTRGARRGEQRARQRIIQLKERAAAGDPEARRTWKIYRLVAEMDEREIQNVNT